MAPARLVDWWLVGTPVVEELAGKEGGPKGARPQGDRRERVTPPENDLPLGSCWFAVCCCANHFESIPCVFSFSGLRLEKIAPEGPEHLAC